MTAGPDPLVLPGWADRVVRQHAAGVSHMFVLYGNVEDWVPCADRFLPLPGYLDELLCHRDLVLRVHPAAGLRIEPPEGARRVASVAKLLQGRAGQLDPLDLVERLLESPPARELRAAVILEQADAWIPETPSPTAAIRTRIARLMRWASDPGLRDRGVLFLLLTRNLSDISRRLTESGVGLESVEVPRPDEELREWYLRWFRSQHPDVKLHGGFRRLAELAGGLSLAQMEDVLLRARGEGRAMTSRDLAHRKVEIINQEYGDVVEVVRPRYGLDAVGGYGYLVRYLSRVASHMRLGRRRHVPMGIIIMGPPGTGKTFIVECFAKECGLLAVKAKTLRSKWVGESERNQERFFSILRALEPVVVIIDESESQEGARDPSSPRSSEVDSRMQARSLQFWGDGENRGRIVRIDITNWPQMIDPAMRRSGRTDAKIPVLMPTLEDRAEILRVLFRKHGIRPASLPWRRLAERTEGYTPANLEQIVLIADEHATHRGGGQVEARDLDYALEDFILPRMNRGEAEAMALAALEEASRRSLMPPKAEEILARLRQRREAGEL